MYMYELLKRISSLTALAIIFRSYSERKNFMQSSLSSELKLSTKVIFANAEYTSIEVELIFLLK